MLFINGIKHILFLHTCLPLEMISPGHTQEPWEVNPVAGGYTHDFLFLFACGFSTLLNIFLKPDTDLFVVPLTLTKMLQAWILKPWGIGTPTLSDIIPEH